METDLPNDERRTSTTPPSSATRWSTVEEAAAHFRRSAWFVRKVANEMSGREIDRHPIKAGRDWLIDIDGMTAFFSQNAVESSATTSYPIAQVDVSLPGETPADEVWGWNEDVA
jgi:hypothetical protein